MSELTSLVDSVEFAENPEPRCPCVLLLDTSGSMRGDPIQALNDGLRTFRNQLVKDSVAARRVEVAVVTFDSKVEVVQDFVTADAFNPPELTALGATAMGTAILKALDMIQLRKAQYRNNGVAYYRPWVFMITDGEPKGERADAIQEAAGKVLEFERAKHVAFFAVGVEDANMSRLTRLAVRMPVKLKGLNFTDMFIWLSASLQTVSQSRLDEQVPLAPPHGWAEI